MANKIIFFISCLGLVTMSCNDPSSNSVSSSIVEQNSALVPDSIQFSRRGKADYVDLGDYKLEQLSLSLDSGLLVVSSEGEVFFSSVLETGQKAEILSLLKTIDNKSKNQIFNSNTFWNPEFELRVFYKDSSLNYTIKCFGQHGEAPEDVFNLHRPLLRLMAQAHSLGE